METQDVFFWRLAGRSVPTGLAIVHWIGCINAIQIAITHLAGGIGKRIKLEDHSQKKKIMFLHSKNKASRKGYKGEC